MRCRFDKLKVPNASKDNELLRASLSLGSFGDFRALSHNRTRLYAT